MTTEKRKSSNNFFPEGDLSPRTPVASNHGQHLPPSPPYLSLNLEDNSLNIINPTFTPIHSKSNLLSSNEDMLIPPTSPKSPKEMSAFPNLPNYLIPEDSVLQVGIDINDDYCKERKYLNTQEKKPNFAENFAESQSSLYPSPLTEI